MLTVFVYGTLKPGEAGYLRYCEPYVVTVQPAWARGHLFHLPQGYPAMTTGDRWIEGTWVHLDEAALAEIDTFESYNPTLPDTENLYVRRVCPVFSAERAVLGSAWVYLMELQRVLKLGGIEIPEGVWSGCTWPSITLTNVSRYQES